MSRESSHSGARAPAVLKGATWYARDWPVDSPGDTIRRLNADAYRGRQMGKRPSAWVLANSRGTVWPDQKPNLERSAAYLLLMWDKVPRDWGNRKVPPGALAAKRIQREIGISDDDGPEANQHYMSMKEDTLHFNNPVPGYAACYELTAEGKRWAKELLAEAEDGRKPWLLDWRD
jgi:hypothetical protein